MTRRCWILALGLSLWTTMAACKPDLDLTFEVDLGNDVGQNFGTIFQAQDSEGRLVAGAGFQSVYNTYYRGERYQIQFFVRPETEEEGGRIDPFPRPSKIASHYIYNLGHDLFFRFRSDPERLLRFDPEENRWVRVSDGNSHGTRAATVAGKLLESRGGKVFYDGTCIFDPPDHPIYRYYYYGQGHLFFYRETRSTDSEPQKAVVALPWSPYSENAPANLDEAKVLEIFLPPEFPYAWGQLGNEVLTCSNWGGLYAFDGENWKILRKPKKGVSYQVYTMINHGDRLLMGQYPSGFFFEYDGQEVKQLSDWPPVPEGASSSARELQTAAIYRGELFAGVWPWAECWRLDPDSETWKEAGRLFRSPAVHEVPVHPYENEAKQAGLVLNQLGQRLTSMVPFGRSLVMSTSWKGGEKEIDASRVKGLSPEQIAEFGSLHQLTLPGNLETVIEWKARPIRLRFVLQDGKMLISQDGKVLAEAVFPEASMPSDSLELKLGEGVFGRSSAEIREVSAKE